MEGFELLSFIGILRECFKILSKNGKLVATITTFSILLRSLLFYINMFSTEPVVRDLDKILPTLMNPNGTSFAESFTHIGQDVLSIVSIQLALLIPSFVESVFFMASVVLASAVACSGKTISISFRDLVSRVVKLCWRPLVTSFHVKLLSTGYIVICCALLIFLVMVYVHHSLIIVPILITLFVFATILWIYLSVVWELALVISVIEEGTYGIEALGKAGGLIKGQRLRGFALNFLFALAFLFISPGFRMTRNQKLVSTQIVCGFFLTVLSCIVTMVIYMSYTVLYLQCKKIHGEEIELQGSSEYRKIPSTPSV